MNFLDILPAPGPLRRYRAHGLTIEVDRPAPRLVLAGAEDVSEPIRLHFGGVPEALETPETENHEFQATANQYLYRMAGYWTVLVEDGVSARFDALGPIGEDHIWYSAVTNAVAAAGYQRGLYPLHGSGVLFPGGTVAFVGATGAGKTTAVAGLVQRGFEVFCDDLCLVAPRDGRYFVGRGAPELRLIRDAVTAIGWDVGESIGFQASRDKFAFARKLAGREEAPLRAIVELAFDDGPPRLERLNGAAPLRVIVEGIRLNMALHQFPASRRAAAFALVSEMARAIPVYRFVRPRTYEQFNLGLTTLIDQFGA